MRLANTTFVNLRTALNDLTPLVNASKPVAPKLEKLLAAAAPARRGLGPDRQATCRRSSTSPGPNNDLIDLTRLGVPLADATVDNIKANGKVRPGAFPQSITALNDSTPELAVARPYAVDLTGWFEGYSHPGTEDANGGSSRVAPVVGRRLDRQRRAQHPAGVRRSLRCARRSRSGSNGQGGLLTTGQGDRCPGSMERGAVYYPGERVPV